MGDGRNVGALGFGASCGSEAAISRGVCCACRGLERGGGGGASVDTADTAEEGDALTRVYGRSRE